MFYSIGWNTKYIRTKYQTEINGQIS